MRMLTVAISILLATVTYAVAGQTRAPAPATSIAVRAETVVSGLVNPWALVFLPDGRMLVSERPGRLRLVARDGQLSAPLAGLPPIAARGQGGLLDLTLDRDFATNSTFYFTFAEARDGGAATSVGRAKLVATGGAARLDQVEVIFRQQPAVGGGLHFGSRLVQARDGRLFLALGDRMQIPRVQSLDNHFGKVIRIETDGRVPADNPFVGRSGAKPEIWSFGHRNVQAAALDPRTGKLWTVEHGAQGGDEVNIPQRGRNYGWPVITYGVNYGGARIGEGTAKPGMEQPVYYWDPSIAPSGMAFYDSDRIPQWKGNLFVGALVQTHLARLVLDGDTVVAEERLLEDLGERIRDVAVGPDGLIYLATDSPDGRILRVVPR